MKTLLTILFIFIKTILVAQTDTNSFNTIFINPETYPEFPGGTKALYCFIDDNIDKRLLKSADTTGTVVAECLIDTTGKITEIKIVKPLTEEIGIELIRVINLMPNWKPGKHGEKAVDFIFVIPIKIPYENNFCR